MTMGKKIKAAAAVLVLAALAGAPARAGQRTVSFGKDALIEVNFLANECSARGAGGNAKDYYREVAETIARHGGEIFGTFDVYQVTNGIVRPESIGVVQWPDAEAFKAFKAEIDGNGLGARTQVWRNFYRLAGGATENVDVTVTFDDDKIYEFVTLLPNPLGGDKMKAFRKAVMEVAAADYTRTPLVALAPADVSGAGLQSDLKAAGSSITQWDSRKVVDDWFANAEVYGKNAREFLDPAVDRRELIWTEPSAF